MIFQRFNRTAISHRGQVIGFKRRGRNYFSFLVLELREEKLTFAIVEVK